MKIVTRKHYFLSLLNIAISILIFNQFSAAAEPPIKIGVISSLGNIGATWSKSANLGMELAVKQINSTGGVAGRQLILVHEDDQFKPNLAISAYQKLIEIDKVDLIIGPQLEQTLSAVAPLARIDGRILITTVATTPTNTKKHDLIIHSVPPDKYGGACLGKTIIADGKRKVVFLIPEESYSETFAGFVRNNLQSAEINYINFHPDTTDFNALLIKAKNLRPDALVLFFVTPEQANLAYKKMDELKFKVSVYSNEVLHDSDTFIKSSGQIAAGTTYCAIPFSPKESKVAAILSALPDVPPLPLYAVVAYDTIHWLAAALADVGTDQKKLLEKIYAMKFNGSFAEYSFDEVGDLNFTAWEPWEVTSTDYAARSTLTYH